MRSTLWMSMLALGAVVAVSGCREDQQTAQATTASNTPATTHVTHTAPVARITIPSGTALDVSLGTAISSETASIGDSWTGTLRSGYDGLPAGSAVSGTVSGVVAAEKGNRAMLDLAVSSIMVGDHRYPVHAGMESVVAGSPRARNLGAIAGATAVGAIIGHAVGGNDKGTIIGGIVGGGAATGVVAKSKGYQVVLKSGTPLTFTTNESVAVR